MRRVLYPIILNRVAQSVGADESRSFTERSRAVALRKSLAVPWFLKALCLAGVVLFVPQVAWASAYGAGSLVRVSGTSPFAGSNCGLAGQTGKNFLNSEVEPFVDVSPANGENIIGVWQQDRWSNGASRGNVVGASLDGGKKWKVIKQTKNSLCTGGTAANGGGYERASDPWVTISPNGNSYLMSLSVDQDSSALGDFNPEAMLVSKSTHGGLTWSNPSTLIRDANPRRFNDKNSISADPNDSRYVYDSCASGQQEVQRRTDQCIWAGTGLLHTAQRARVERGAHPLG